MWNDPFFFLFLGALTLLILFGYIVVRLFQEVEVLRCSCDLGEGELKSQDIELMEFERLLVFLSSNPEGNWYGIYSEESGKATARLILGEERFEFNTTRIALLVTVLFDLLNKVNPESFSFRLTDKEP